MVLFNLQELMERAQVSVCHRGQWLVTLHPLREDKDLVVG